MSNQAFQDFHQEWNNLLNNCKDRALELKEEEVNESATSEEISEIIRTGGELDLTLFRAANQEITLKIQPSECKIVMRPG